MNPINEDSSADMPAEEFRERVADVADWIADYLQGVGDQPVMSPVSPGDIVARIPASAPASGIPMKEILDQFRADILPGVTHWNHPSFFAYFAITGSGPGILGEMVAAGLNVNAMLWHTAPAATELEVKALDWLRQMMALPDDFSGVLQDTASSATLTAIAAARERAVPGVRERGLAGSPPLRLYCSEEAHSSVDRAAIAVGIGLDGIRKIPTDDRFGLRPEALREAIHEDVRAGFLPFCVVATVGTTSTTAIDPLPAVAEICDRSSLWLHVDAAYAGSAAILPELRHILDGAEAADSLVVNPHKWMFVPIDCSALFFRDPAAVRAAFSLTPEYLRTDRGDVTNLMDFGPALGRRFRALKLWMTIRYFGSDGLAARIREHIRLARLFSEWVQAEPGWECVAPVDFSVVVFRRVSVDADGETTDRINERILQRVNSSGQAFLSHTRVNGRYVLRLAIGNLRTTEEHIRAVWSLLRQADSGEGV